MKCATGLLGIRAGWPGDAVHVNEMDRHDPPIVVGS
jgi:hypothetical protein